MKESGSGKFYVILAVLVLALFILAISFSPALQTFVAPNLPTFSYIHQVEAQHLRCDDLSRTCNVLSDKPFTITPPLISGDFKFEPPSSTSITSWITTDGKVKIKFGGNVFTLKPSEIVDLSTNVKVRVLPTISYTFDDKGVNYVKDVKLRFDFFLDTKDKLYSKMTSAKQEGLNTKANFEFNTYNDVYGGLVIRNMVREGSKLFFTGEKTYITEDKKASNVASYSVPVSTDQIGDMLYKVQPSIVFHTGNTEYLVPGTLTAETIKIVPKVVGEENVVPEPATIFTPKSNPIVVEPTNPKISSTGWFVLIFISIAVALSIGFRYKTGKRRRKR